MFLDRITPSVNLPASLRADSINAFCAGDSSRNRAIFSTSSGGIDRQIHHSIILSMGSAALGRSSTFCVASQNQAPNFQIGRASCRERGCQYVAISVVAGSLKKKKTIKNK